MRLHRRHDRQVLPEDAQRNLKTEDGVRKKHIL
jgi:uncharacterized membrane protein